MRPDILEESEPNQDAAEKQTRATTDWTDSTNQRLLGPKSWRAELPKAQAQAVEAALDQPRPEPYPIDLRVRQWSIDIATEVIEECFAPADPSGRFVVHYNLVADGTRAVFEDVYLSHFFLVDQQTFADCVVERLRQRHFRSSEHGRMSVSRPFVYDAPPSPRRIDAGTE